jgi:hypothetical protein
MITARIKLTDQRGTRFGDLMGLVVYDDDTTMAVVRFEGYGMFLSLVHPSEITFTTPEEEETYKP